MDVCVCVCVCVSVCVCVCVYSLSKRTSIGMCTCLLAQLCLFITHVHECSSLFCPGGLWGLVMCLCACMVVVVMMMEMVSAMPPQFRRTA